MNASATITEELAEQRPRYFAIAYYGSEDGAGDEKAAVFYRSTEERQAIREAWYEQGHNVRIVGVSVGKDGTPRMSIADADGYDTTDITESTLDFVAEHKHGGTLEAGTLREAFEEADAQNAGTIRAMLEAEKTGEAHIMRKGEALAKFENDEAKHRRLEAVKATFAAAAALVEAGKPDEASDTRAIAAEIILAEFSQSDLTELDPAAVEAVNDIGGDRMLDYLGEIETDAGKAVELMERFPWLFGRKSEIIARIEYETRERQNEARAFDRELDEQHEKERETARKIAAAEEWRDECLNAADTLQRVRDSIQ